MGFGQLAGLALASLVTLVMAEDLLFYSNMTYQEYTQATTVLGFTGMMNVPSLSENTILTHSQR